MPTFLLGAGFNADAAREAGHHQPDFGYPLVGDTLRLCFDLSEIPEGKSIEDLFSGALERRDYGPVARLADRLRFADYYVASELAKAESENCYQQFFRTFPDSNFLTFKHDSLPETFLFRLGRWSPRDGYGVRVTAHLLPGAREFGDMKSTTLVLHLHGSLCIRTSEFEARRKPGESMAWLTERDEPRYAFDPLSISVNFTLFYRDVGADDVQDRIIVPVPDKSRGLKQVFIRDTYIKAVGIVRDSDIVVAIGYSFNAHDRGSYQKLLDALRVSKSRKLLVVSPDADAVARAIRADFPDLFIQPQETTFKQWAAASFPGVDSRR